MITAAATYSDTDTFTLPGDYTSRLTAGKVVQIQVAAGMVYSTVASSSYGGGTTTVNLNNAVLTDPISRVYVVATRDGLWPNGPGYIVATDYGSPGQTALDDALTAISSSERTLVLTPGSWSITADTTIPANVTLAPQRGAVLSIATGITLTINGGLQADPVQIFSWAGTGKVVLGAGAVKEAYPEWWGAKGDGATDCTSPIAAATNAAQGRMPIRFVGDDYQVTDTLALTVWNYSWVGKRTDRGQSVVSGYHATKITFRPVDTTKYLVSRYDPTAVYWDEIGPFEHVNLTFDIGDANGFEFGRADVNGDGTDDDCALDSIQKLVSGVAFRHCSLVATEADRECVDGVLTRSGRKLVDLTKAFETAFEDVTLRGGDTQIKCHGCDRPYFSKVRSNYSHIPFLFNGSTNGFGVAASLTDIQIESWTFGGIITRGGAGITAANLRLEQNDGAPTGGRRYDLTTELSITAAVTVGGASLTFSQDMTGILFPYLSLIELSDGSPDNTTTCLVTSVSGATVGIDAQTYLHWAHAGAIVVRIHGYGPMHRSESGAEACYTNVDLVVAGEAPAFVYVPKRGTMNITNAGMQGGADIGGPSLVIGNLIGEQFYLNQQMNFVNCSPLICAAPEHPLVTTNNWRQNYGASGYDGNFRSKSGDLFGSFSQVQRVWAFTPKDMNMMGWDVCLYTPTLKLAGEADTDQSLYAWLLKGNPVGQIMFLDRSLPTSGYVRVRVKAKAKGAGGKLVLKTTGVDWATALVNITLSTSAWTIWEAVIPCPADWQGARDSKYGGPGFVATWDTADIYIAAVTVEEMPIGLGLPVLTAAPANPYQGQMAIADRVTWNPKALGSGGPYLVWWNGTAWARIDAQ